MPRLAKLLSTAPSAQRLRILPCAFGLHRAALSASRAQRSFPRCALAAHGWSHPSTGVPVTHFHSGSSLSATASPSPSPSSSSPLIDFKLADIGEGIAECEIIRWFVAPGDWISQFDRVCEVQSDKANVEITSRYDGRVKELKYKVGELAKVGAPLMTLEVGGSAGGAAATEAKETKEKDFTAPVLPEGQSRSEESLTAAGYPLSSVPSHRLSSIDEGELTRAAAADVSEGGDYSHATSEEVEVSFGKVQTSPAVRRIAKEGNVDLTKVKGTGPQARILKDDVARYAQSRANSAAPRTSPPSPSPPPPRPTAATAADRFPSAAPISSPPSPSSSPTPASTPAYLSSDQTVPIGGLQRIMVQTMTAANLVPHFTFGEEFNLDALSDLRDSLKPSLAALGLKVSYLPFFIKALSLALRSFPQLNAHVNADCTAVTHRADHNIGVAMDTAKGLLVPNIKRVQDRSILDIARELHRLSALGRAGQLTRDDLQGGTITLSNIGSVGGTYCSPIIVVPEVCISALGSVRVLPRFDERGQVKATKVMNVSWSGDHRVVDGATIARFNAAWKAIIEQPNRILVELR